MPIEIWVFCAATKRKFRIYDNRIDKWGKLCRSEIRIWTLTKHDPVFCIPPGNGKRPRRSMVTKFAAYWDAHRLFSTAKKKWNSLEAERYFNE